MDTGENNRPNMLRLYRDWRMAKIFFPWFYQRLSVAAHRLHGGTVAKRRRSVQERHRIIWFGFWRLCNQRIVGACY